MTMDHEGASLLYKECIVSLWNKTGDFLRQVVIRMEIVIRKEVR
jgi:hypothetical protein